MAGILARSGLRLLSRPILDARFARPHGIDPLQTAAASPCTRSFAAGLCDPPPSNTHSDPPPHMHFDATYPKLFVRYASADAHHGAGVTHAGLTLHKPARWHVLWGTGMSALMWCEVLQRPT